MLTLSPAMYADLMLNKDRDKPHSGNPLTQISGHWGVPVRSSPMFPMRNSCELCSGTGEGAESTYCKRCNGAGETCADGMMQEPGGRVTLFTRSLPKKFKPYFPRGLVGPPKLCRGLP